MAGNAREVALLTLSACEKQGAWSDLALKKNIHSVGLDGRDAALATRLCWRASEQDASGFYIGKFSSVRVERMENRVLNALRLGVYPDGVSYQDSGQRGCQRVGNPFPQIQQEPQKSWPGQRDSQGGVPKYGPPSAH